MNLKLMCAIALSGAAAVSVAEPVVPNLGSGDEALRDLQAGRPLAGLPSLNKPVHVAKGEYICQSGGALRNPDKVNLISIGACVVTPQRLRVRVIQPSDDQAYLESDVFRMVKVTWTATAVSDATVYVGWAFIPALAN